MVDDLDLDFDAVERMLDEGDKVDDKASERKRSRSDRKRSRDRKDRDRDRERDRERDRRRRSRDRRSRSKSDDRRKEAEREAKELERRQKQIEDERQKQLDQAKRDDCTVLVMCLHHKAGEREVYEFFSKNSGKVRDVQIIRDSRTQRSKGIAYVEFYLTESVLKSLACSGQLLMGTPIRVQASQAEKNRAAQNQKMTSSTIVVEQPLKLFVGGLTDALENITEAELLKLFEPFGSIDYIDLHQDPYTGKCKGFAYVQYKSSNDAREAMQAMNGFELAGQTIRVGIHQQTPVNANLALTSGDLNDPSVGDPAQRLRLMQNLAGGAAGVAPAALPALGALPAPVGIPGSIAPALAAQSGMAPLAPMSGLLPSPGAANVSSAPSCNLILKNMFDPDDPDVKNDPEFFTDVHEDVHAECSKHGAVAKLWVDQAQAFVWVKFEQPTMSTAAKNALHGRWFSGKQIIADFTPDEVFAKMVADS
jgi:RNA-binding protein 39